jgi:hypothetical protein
MSGNYQRAEYRTPDGLLVIEQTYQEVTWEDAPVETWAATDSHGHRHAFTRPARPGREQYINDRGLRRNHTVPTHYPSLYYKIDRWHACDGREGLYSHDPHWAVDESHYECRQCRERIEPAHGPGSKLIPASRKATLTEATTRPPAGWVAEGQLAGDVQVERRAGVTTYTRTRLLLPAEAKQRWAAAIRAEQQEIRQRHATAVAAALGYPEAFT